MGFIPRFFDNTAQDRYIIEEEQDVTEIYFIMKGNWAVSFNAFFADDNADASEKTQLLPQND